MKFIAIKTKDGIDTGEISFYCKMLRGAIAHSDRGSQYTSEAYRKAIKKFGLIQSMNSAGGRCHDNAKCESLCARFKEELLYSRYNTEKMTMTQVKTLVW
jgi:transposase InsO family protein